MFLPRVVRSTRVMKKAVAAAHGRGEENKPAGDRRAHCLLRERRRHDIAKNIVGVVLACNIEGH